MALELGPECNGYEVDTSNFCKRDWDLIKVALEGRIAAMEEALVLSRVVSETDKVTWKKDIEDMKTIVNVIKSGSEVEDDSEDDWMIYIH